MTIDEIEKVHNADMIFVSKLSRDAYRQTVVRAIEPILKRESALIKMLRQLEADKAGLVVERDILWCLLDDIDTAEDMFKPEITNHFRYVNKKHRLRFNVCNMTDERHDKARQALKAGE